MADVAVAVPLLRQPNLELDGGELLGQPAIALQERQPARVVVVVGEQDIDRDARQARAEPGLLPNCLLNDYYWASFTRNRARLGVGSTGGS